MSRKEDRFHLVITDKPMANRIKKIMIERGMNHQQFCDKFLNLPIDVEDELLESFDIMLDKHFTSLNGKYPYEEKQLMRADAKAWFAKNILQTRT